MRIFDTNVQKLKYDVLREVARHAYEDTLQDAYLERLHKETDPKA